MGPVLLRVPVIHRSNDYAADIYSGIKEESRMCNVPRA